jgi:tetratricopeptide (TPR) repeat protein
MIVRCVKLALVSSVLFAALGANPGTSIASTGLATNLSAQAYEALNGGDAAKSLVLYGQAIGSGELGPDALANALLNRALAFQQTQQYEKAIGDYTAALTLDAMSSPLRATALYNRGLAQQKSNQLPLAIEDFTSALLINSSFSHAYLARANALRDSGQYLFALSDYERAIKYNHPEQARVYFAEAQTYELLRRPADAKKFLKASLQADASFKPAIEKMKLLGDVAELDDAISDPILTSSTIANITGSTEVVKPVLPKGVEPPAELMAQGEVPATEPTFAENQKLYSDRVPAGDINDVETASISPAPALPVKDATVKIASVPKIPAKLKVAAAETPAAATAKIVKKPKPVAEAAVVETAAAVAGWAVQVASASSEDGAWTTWKNMQKRFKSLHDQKPNVVKADLGAKGTFYRVRFSGFASQSEAQSSCGKLKSTGVSCYISKV